MKEHYLYAIVVENRIWGELSVCAGNHYEIHAIQAEAGKSEEDTVQKYIWELQCECADSYGQPERYECENCGEPAEDCECGATYCEEEDYSEFVENNSCYRAEKYDPSNIDHVLCPGAEEYRDTTERKLILVQKAKEDKLRKLSRLNVKIATLEEDILIIKKERDLLVREFEKVLDDE